MSELDAFAVVELMGHRRTVGRVTEATIAGGEFIRVDATPLGVEQEGPTVNNPGWLRCPGCKVMFLPTYKGAG